MISTEVPCPGRCNCLNIGRLWSWKSFFCRDKADPCGQSALADPGGSLAGWDRSDGLGTGDREALPAPQEGCLRGCWRKPQRRFKPHDNTALSWFSRDEKRFRPRSHGLLCFLKMKRSVYEKEKKIPLWIHRYSNRGERVWQRTHHCSNSLMNFWLKG